MNAATHGALHHPLFINVKVSLGLRTESLLRMPLWACSEHPGVPFLNTADKTERLVGQTGFTTAASACSLHITP